MSKTLELNHRAGTREQIVITSPDHEETFNVNAYDIEGAGNIIFEDQFGTIDYPDDMYAHIDVQKGKFQRTAQISFEDEPEAVQREVEMEATAVIEESGNSQEILLVEVGDKRFYPRNHFDGTSE
jgi:hypothetical protein